MIWTEAPAWNWFTGLIQSPQNDERHHVSIADDETDLGGHSPMTEFMTSRDLAAAELFMPSQMALRHTLSSVAKGVLEKYPNSRGGNVHVEFWTEGGVYWSWYFLNQKLNLPRSEFSLAFGICFPEAGSFGGADAGKLPQHEPFFFILLRDDLRKRRASELLTTTPEGWFQINKEHEAVVVRPISQFDADPDLRAAEITPWAQLEVGRLVALIDGLGAAAAGT